MFINKIAFTVSISCFSQDFNNYQPLEIKGEIPIQLRTSTAKKVEDDMKNHENLTYYQKNIRKEFSIKSNFYIDELLLSGKILFNEPVSDYVTKVGKKILENENKSFRDSIHFFVLRSDLTNAFATNQGLVFVTLGLLSQIENEAQLAFVLGHEIGHIKKKHVIDNYLKEQKLIKNNNSRYYSHDDKIKLLSKYSRTAEFEADSMGYHYMDKTEYKKNSMLSIFDVLQYSYLPFDEIKFDVTFLDQNESFPNDVKRDTILDILVDEDYDDSKSTHPNIRKRKAKITKYALSNGGSMNKGVDFIVSKEEFFKVRKLARYETVRLNLRDREYIKALYNIQVLEKENPNSIYLKKSRMKAIYGIAKYKTRKKYSKITDDWDDYEGEISNAYRIFEKIDQKALHFYALNYLYKENLKIKDPHVSKLTEDLAWELLSEYDVNLNVLKSYVKKSIVIEEEIVKDTTEQKEEEIDYDKLSKYEKIKLKQGKSISEDVKNRHQEYYYCTVFQDIIEDKDFITFFQEVEEDKDYWDDQEKKEKQEYESLSPYEQKKRLNLDEQNEMRLGLKKMLIVDPFYFKIDERKGLKILDSEKKQIEFNDNLQMLGNKVGIDTKLISSKNLSSDDTENFKNMALLYDWVGERMLHENFYFIPSETEYIQTVKEKYGTENVSFPGILAFKEQRDNKGSVLFVCAICYPLLPYGIYYAVTPVYHTYFYNIIFDIETGKIKMSHLQEMRANPNKSFINSIIYEQMLKISLPEKE